jgi:hypothetical protein
MSQTGRGKTSGGGKRESKFTLLLSKEEHSQLHELAARAGEPASILLRRFIREAHKSTTSLSTKGRAAQ